MHCTASLIHCFSDWLFIDSLIYALIRWLTASALHWFSDSWKFMHCLIHCFRDWLFFDWLIYWFVGSLVLWFSVHWFMDSVIQCSCILWFIDSLVHWFGQYAVHGFFHVSLLACQPPLAHSLMHFTNSTLHWFCISKKLPIVYSPLIFLIVSWCKVSETSAPPRAGHYQTLYRLYKIMVTDRIMEKKKFNLDRRRLRPIFP